MKQPSRWIVLFMLALGAILTGLTLVFPVLGFLQWLTMIPLIFAAFCIAADERVSLLHAYGYGFFTVFLYYGVLYHWFVNLYPLDFAGLDHAASIVVVIAGWVGLSLLQAIPGGLVFLLFVLLCRTTQIKRTPVLRPFVFAALWIIFEWSSTLSWVGVPWGRLALGQINFLPMLQSASLLGSYFVSFLILAVNGLLAHALLTWKTERIRAIVCGAVAVALVVCNLAYGLVSMRMPQTKIAGVPVAVIQGNISSHDKWDSSGSSKICSTYAELTRQAAEDGAKLVVWPETVLPYSLNLRNDLKAFLSNLARECEVTLAVGSFYTVDRDVEYNAIYWVDPDGTIREEFYAKRHLVPFGEYVPMEELITALIPPLASLSDLGGDMTAGEATSLFETSYGAIGSLICFDSIYEQLTLSSVRDGAQLMIVSSNDSWFYDSAAVYQHQAQSQLRAIESGRGFVRSANTGISTVISAKGEILAWIDPLTEGYAVASVTVSSERTLYTVIGNTFIYLNIAFLALLGASELLYKRRTRDESSAETIPVENA